MASTSWEKLPDLSPHLLKVLTHKLSMTAMMPVQEATIPLFMQNKDVCVEAVTGSGKTLAFLIPMLQMLIQRCREMKKHHVAALIISPTRELASQIMEVLQIFLDPTHCNYTTSLFIGGQGDIQNDLDDYIKTGANIIVGTPGRISYALDKSPHLCSGIKFLEVLVLDEADRLLDLGFHRALSTILSFLPKQRRTGLFSATLTDEVDQLIKAGLRNPVKIIVKEKTASVSAGLDGSLVRTPITLSNQYMLCKSPTAKFNKLVAFISGATDCKMLVFFSTCACVDYFGRGIKELLDSKLNILLLHGKLKKKRLAIFNKFRALKSGVLICTDVMARGVDIPDVDWVLQFDPPSNVSAFVHRCGRTARVGRKGNALLFLLHTEAAYVDFIKINQHAPMKEYVESGNAQHDWVDKLRSLAMLDRGVMERGTRAFVSFVQSYAKHECSLIFRLKDLSLGELATGFALLRMPKMPELRKKQVEGFEPAPIDVDAIKYKDKNREKQRQQEKKRSATSCDKPKFIGRSMKAWSDTKRRKEEKRQKKEVKKLRNKRPKLDEDELEELCADARLVKKLKNKKISKSDYDEALTLEEDKVLKSSLE